MGFFTGFYKFYLNDIWVVLLLLTIQLPNWLCFEQDLTVTVAAGREECFYQTVITGQVIDIEFQVIDGGSGNLDVHFGLYSPRGDPIVVDFKKTEAMHRHEAKNDGDYRLCFDNTFSRISDKIVYFALVLDDDDDDDEEEAPGDAGTRGSTPSSSDFGLTAHEIYEMTVEDIQEKVNVVRNNLQRVKHLQEQLRAFEARDRNIQERNFSMVNNFSFIQLSFMLIVGFIQVVMLRSLFDDKSRVRKIWKFANEKLK